MDPDMRKDTIFTHKSPGNPPYYSIAQAVSDAYGPVVTARTVGRVWFPRTIPAKVLPVDEGFITNELFTISECTVFHRP